MEEVRGQFNDVLIISEMRGAYPNVPIAADVDYAALIAGDPDPMFVTLPIGKVNVKSGNNRYYDEAFVTELMRQTLANKPIGLMGHLSESERATAFPKESIHWVGAVRDGDLVWGKGYVVGEARDRLRRYKASGKSIATSIDALAEGKWDESLKAFRMNAATLKLGQIDIAPADRAGIPDLAAVPVLTTEMQAEEQVQPEKENKMTDKLTVINEMTADDVRLLPKVVRDAVLADVPAPPQVAMVQELCAALGVEESKLTATVTEMRQEQETQRKQAIKSRITELAADPEKGVKVEAVRGLVVELVEARQPATVQEAEAAYQQVIEMAAVKAALAAQVQNTMGPRQRTTVQPQAGGGRKYFEIPADKETA